MRKPKTKSIEMLDFPMFIGSRGRIYFPMANLCAGFLLLVEPQELKKYSASHSVFNKVIALEKDNGGFGYMMNSILKEAKKRGFDYFMFCDDDLLGFSSRDSRKGVVLNDCFKQGVALMKERGLSQLGIAFGGHDFYQIKEGKRFYKNKLFTDSVGIWGMFIGKTDDLLKVGGYDEYLPIYNDWDISASLLLSGYKISRWNQYHFDHKMKSLKGGAEVIYDRKELMKRAEEVMRKKYGDAVKLVVAHDQYEIRLNFRKIAKMTALK